jgi:hypothetical protein
MEDTSIGTFTVTESIKEQFWEDWKTWVKNIVITKNEI